MESILTRVVKNTLLHPGSFRIRLFALVLLLVVPTLILALFGNFQRQRSEKERAREGATTISKLAAAKQEYYVRQSRQLLSTMTQFAILVQLKDKKASEVGLKNLKLLSPDYDDFGLIETNGDIFCHTLGPGIVNAVSRPLMEKALRRPGFHADTFQRLGANELPIMQFAHPVRNTNGDLVRVMYASLKPARVSEALAEVSLPEGGAVNAFDSKGNLLGRFPPLKDSDRNKKYTASFLNTSLKKKKGAFEAVGLDGERRLYAVSPVGDKNDATFFVAVGVPTREFFAEANQRFLAGCILAVSTVGILLAFAWWYSDRLFLRPLSAMAAAAERITSGDLTVRTGLPKGKSELHVFAQRFDKMAESMERRQRELEGANEKITAHNAELEQRVAERTSELQHLNMELEAFSYSVSHDLRAPLRHVHGYVEMLMKTTDGQLSAKAQRYLKIIGEASVEMGQLIDDLLAFSRMSRIELKKNKVVLNELIEECVGGLEMATKDRVINWKISRLPAVEGDWPLLKQVFSNLIGNAVKYTRDKNPAEIEIGSQADGGGEVTVFVRDNGAGFDMQYVNKLFGVFQRLHAPEDFEGTGIGLAIVRRVIQRHGGRVWAEGAVTQGATFYFTLKAAKENKSDHAKA